MDVTIVGSGTLLPDDAHRSAGHLVRWTRGSLLLDCGSGVLHGLARDGLDWRAITHVAISHFHTDHVGDLAALLWAWTHGGGEGELPSRTILGPRGIRQHMEALAAAHGEFVLDPGGGLRIVELEREGDWEDVPAGLTLRTCPARHTPEALVLRVELAGGTLGYTGDTGPDPRLAPFLAGVEVLIAACAVPDGSPVEIHLSPLQVGDLAAAAGPSTLILTHLYPQVPRDGIERTLRERGVTGRVLLARDGDRVTLSGGGGSGNPTW